MPTGDMHGRQRRKNLALALGLGGLILIFFLLTVFKLGAGSS